MTCQDARLYLDAYLDNELDVAGSLRLEQHIAACPACAQFRRESQMLRAALRNPELRYQPRLPVRSYAPPPLRGFLPQPALALVLASLLLAAGAVFLTRGVFLSRGMRQDPLVSQVLASHIRSLQPGHLTDVLSTDRHTVKPWFQGKLAFSPPVPDPPSADWTLVGGRLDYLDNRPVAALVYAWRKHTVNVFVWPSPHESREPLRQETEQGYQIMHFANAGMTWWIVSDLNAADLGDFARALAK
jgi:anti-sigma factor RsiW